jgi:putative transposase
MDFFKPRVQIRLQEFDYSEEGYYFVTICTSDHKNIFGLIKDGQMKLNTFGMIAENSWKGIPLHFKNTELDEFIVMPNHIHGIIIINPLVGAGHARPLRINNLSQIIGSFKAAVSKQINGLIKIHFQWQRSYYDHIIRTEESLNNIREYIINNPTKWDEDENNPDRPLKGGTCPAPTGLS